MRKIYVAFIAAAIATAALGGILLTHFNESAEASQAHQTAATNGQIAGNDQSKFGPPDDGGQGGADQLLG